MIVFDVDGTLIDKEDQPRWEVIDLLRAMHGVGHKIGVWSGGGVDYAAHWTNRLGLGKYVSWVAAKSSLPEVVKQGAFLFVDDAADADIGGFPVLKV